MGSVEIAADPLLGLVLEGRYRVEAFLARGGMGAVYRGVDLRLERMVAVKFLDERFRSDREVVSRFHREALSAAALEHPNIIPIYGVGATDGQHYFVMKYIEGETVSQLVHDRGRLSLRDALHVAMQVCDGLEHIHARGYVHRDVKPTNIMVDARGHACILDFGILRLKQSNLTQTGFVAGTPEYMSPEQARDAKSTDARSDLYSLGVMLFEMLTGRRPFKADSAFDLLLKHVSEPAPAVTSFAADLPPVCDTIVRRALEKEPAARYSSAAEMREAILAGLHEVEGTSGSTRPRSTLRGLTGVGGVVPLAGSVATPAAGAAAVPAPRSDVRATMIHGEANAVGSRPERRPGGGRPIAAIALSAVLLVGAGVGVTLWLTRRADVPAPVAPAGPLVATSRPPASAAPTAPASVPPLALRPPSPTAAAAPSGSPALAAPASPAMSAPASPTPGAPTPAAKLPSAAAQDGGSGQASAAASAAKKAVGTVDLVTKPAGAALSIGDRELGDAPLEKVTLEPGTYAVVARKRGHSPAKKDVVVKAGQHQKVTLKLRAQQGLLSVIIRHGGELSYAEVLLDGKSLGSAPVSERKVSAGRHKVVIRRAGYRPMARTVNVPAGDVERAVFELTAQ